MKWAIETRGLTKCFGELTAVDSLNMKISHGEVFGLLGPNGAGKTTTLLMLSTLLKPSSGSATVNGFDVARRPAQVRESIGMVFQDPSSDELLTGYENLKLHAMLFGVPSKGIENRIEEVLQLVDLEDRKKDLVKKYSGGMRRRLELARGLLHSPGIIFLDEPTLGLDPQTREHIWEYIEKLVKEKKVTIILTTHYMEEADRLCNRVAIIDHGKIVAQGTPEALKKAIGGDIINLKTKDSNISKLQKLSFVKKVEKRDSVIRLTVKNAGSNLQKILRAAGKVEHVDVSSPTLNDVFLHYTGKEIREQEGNSLEFMRTARRAMGH